ncbi:MULTISPECIES: hydroxyisourate hydrolase [Nocardioides]|jgi:5-hydroxyisourate hydrolase|uniref:hydroxyisourate hydrolase n=1 Tax=Nocardioides TaxID=1839 RepID=UPI0003301389|nr:MULTISPECIES: hydroxyisourate hydrolase [Nocardioides]EON24669.1 transthyretin [Nocardioides sp. CF8]
MTTLSTHVLDTTLGRPASGVAVSLSGEGTSAEAVTDSDGRVADLGRALEPGTYTLRFDSGAYFAQRGTDGFYPEVLVTFTVSGAGHVHVPLLLSPFGYSTYRGS